MIKVLAIVGWIFGLMLWRSDKSNWTYHEGIGYYILWLINWFSLFLFLMQLIFE